ncbi:SecY-interacting protein Syd [Undibacterium sp. Ji83W]|uniref:SecY-interacting protein Syd n=1 Tax=Undibacterium sp. Ji83W TaxID=3413043 RepID=UPI003BF0E23D
MRTIAELLLAGLEWQANFEKIEYIPEWSSPCVILPADSNGFVHWHPAPISDKTTIEKLKLRSEIGDFFTSYFGKPIYANHSGEECIIHASWNQQELESTASDVSLMLSEEIPICIATTNSDFYFGACNKTGTIWLCEPGYPPIRKVSESLHDFLSET